MLNEIKAAIPPTPERAKHIATLSALCGEAAGHVAEARIALGASIDTDGALIHLDQAISCLKRLSAHGRANLVNGAKRRSA